MRNKEVLLNHRAINNQENLSKIDTHLIKKIFKIHKFKTYRIKKRNRQAHNYSENFNTPLDN